MKTHIGLFVLIILHYSISNRRLYLAHGHPLGVMDSWPTHPPHHPCPGVWRFQSTPPHVLRTRITQYAYFVLITEKHWFSIIYQYNGNVGSNVKGTEEDAPEDFFCSVSQELMRGPLATCEKKTTFEASPGATAQSHPGLNCSKASEFEDDADEPFALADSSSSDEADQKICRVQPPCLWTLRP